MIVSLMSRTYTYLQKKKGNNYHVIIRKIGKEIAKKAVGASIQGNTGFGCVGAGCAAASTKAVQNYKKSSDIAEKKQEATSNPIKEESTSKPFTPFNKTGPLDTSAASFDGINIPSHVSSGSVVSNESNIAQKSTKENSENNYDSIVQNSNVASQSENFDKPDEKVQQLKTTTKDFNSFGSFHPPSGLAAGINASFYHGYSQNEASNSKTLPNNSDAIDETSNIPTPPPLPVMSNNLLKVTYSNVNDEILFHAKDQSVENSGDNLRPSQVAKKKKEYENIHQTQSYTYKNKDGSIYHTTIDHNTKPENVTVSFVLQEMDKRGLTKIEEKNTSTIVLLESGEEAVVGNYLNNRKLTALGIAYAKQSASNEIITEKVNLTGKNFKIVTPPQCSSAAILSTGKSKHLLVVEDIENDCFYSPGMLTSKKTGILISEQQFKHYLDPSKGYSDKKQYYQRFEKILTLRRDQVQVIKGGTEYMGNLENEKKNQIKTDMNKTANKGFVSHNPDEITKEAGLEMCKDYDTTIKSGKQHPKTLDQINAEEAGKQKQKNIQEQKKKNKEKYIKEKDNKNET